MTRAVIWPYKSLARYYDRFFTFHLPWFEKARQRVLAPILPRVKAACDLACGTGTTALALASQGIRMFGVDLSPTMRRLARRKAQRLRLPVRILAGDMRGFRLPEPVDLILCEFDALNHVPRRQDLARVATSVWRALQSGGYFFFDVNNRLAFQKVWQGTWFSEKPGIVLLMRSGYDPRQDKGWSDVDWFVREGGRWQRHRERVEQVCWSSKEIRRALRESGFDQIRAWDARRFFGAGSNILPGARTFYLARKRPLPRASSTSLRTRSSTSSRTRR